eukprot:5919409-Pleurochrysis_carterae.AAC.1
MCRECKWIDGGCCADGGCGEEIWTYLLIMKRGRGRREGVEAGIKSRVKTAKTVSNNALQRTCEKLLSAT